MKHIINTIRSAVTIVGPMAVAKRIDMTVPAKAQDMEMMTESTVTPLKVLDSLIAERAGNMISADANSAPKRFIANTTVTAVMMAIRVLYRLALVPVAEAKLSSNVTEKILL